MTNRITKFIFLISLLLLFTANFSLISVKAQNTSIPFRDMEIQLDDVDNYGGVRIVVFFLHTCSACKNEVSTLKEIDADYNVTIFMFDIYQKSTNDTLLEFKEETDAPDQWIFGYVTDESYEEFDPSPIPVTIVLDELGRIVSDIVGIISYISLKEFVVNAIEQNTDQYFTVRKEDPGNYIDVIFICIGVIVSAIVVYFLIQSLPPRKKKQSENLQEGKQNKN